MKVTVKLFAAARELLQRSDIELEVSPGADVGELLSELTVQWPQLELLASRSVVAVNSEYATKATVITEGDELALIPPVSGG